MDLGIRGKKAIICASSRGLGKAIAEQLAQEGVEIVINGTNQENPRRSKRPGRSGSCFFGEFRAENQRETLPRPAPIVWYHSQL